MHLRSLMLLLTCLLAAPGVFAAEVRVNALHIAWQTDHDVLPDLEPAWRAPFRLQANAGGWTAAEAGRPAVRTDLRALSQQGTVAMDLPALFAVRQAIVTAMADQGLLGVEVSIMAPPMRHRGGRSVWFVLSLPLEGGGVNQTLPDNLSPVDSVQQPPQTAPTPTPQPAAAPVPQQTPAPKSTPTPKPAAAPVPQQTPAPKSTPTPKPAAAPVPQQTPAPKSTPTPQPAAAPVPQQTPAPKSTPIPQPALESEPPPLDLAASRPRLGPAPTSDPGPIGETQFWYRVHPFEVAYVPPHAHLPPLEELMDSPFVLGQVDGGWTAPRQGIAAKQCTLRSLNAGRLAWYSDRAMLVIATALSDVLLGQGLQGVSVAPDPHDIVTLGPDAGVDLRRGATSMRFVIRIGRVTEMRTVASGDRVATEDRFNHPIHAHVLDDSPIAPPGDADGAPGGLIHAAALQDYLHFLSRHPNRSVEASVAAASQPGGVALDYIITESRPWTAWYRFGNDGTRSEGYQRQQFGFHHSQLTGNDDILSVMYATSNLRDTNSVNGSYERPIGWDGRLRARLAGSWSQYFADQFGVSTIANAFTGISYSGSGELRANVYQDGPLFIDAIGGVRYQFLNVSNNSIPFLPRFEQAGFVIPYGQLQLEHLGAFSAVQAIIGIEGNVTSHDDLSGLGRFNPADRWARLNWSATASTFLEPLLDAEAWRDPSTPGSSTLAHEVVLNFSGQWSMGNRLLPQFQQVAGGPTSNRGYPVSFIAGDSAMLMSGEYRFHLPRALAPNPQPGELFGEPFRTTRQYVFGRPDWDLVPLAFVDATWLFQEGNQTFELDNTMVSIGVGVEVVFRQNLRARLDWGFALTDVYGPAPGGGRSVIYESGKNRLYGTFTIYF